MDRRTNTKLVCFMHAKMLVMDLQQRPSVSIATGNQKHIYPYKSRAYINAWTHIHDGENSKMSKVNPGAQINDESQ